MFPSGEMPENRESQTLSASPFRFTSILASSPSISPSRADLVIIYPQKSACFSSSLAPPYRLRPESGKNISSPSISPSQTNFWDILPQKKGDFSNRPLPIPPLTAGRLDRGRKNIPSPSISPTWTTFAANYPQKSVCFLTTRAPILTPWPPFPVCQRKRPPIFHITELGRFCGHLPSKNGVKKEVARPHCGFICGGTSPVTPRPCVRGIPLLPTAARRDRQKLR